MRQDNLDVYQRSLDLVELARQLQQELPTGYGFLTEQLRRAVASVPLNIAEGLGYRTRPEQRRFFGTARGSCNEVAAVLDVAQRFGIITPSLHSTGKELCDRIAAMLTRLLSA